MAGAPGARSAAISAGVTQACALTVAEVARPTTVSWGEPGTPCTVTCEPTDACGPFPLPVTCGNGPEAAVTPGSLVVAASRAEETWAFTAAVTCAPRCAAKAWSKG